MESSILKKRMVKLGIMLIIVTFIVSAGFGWWVIRSERFLENTHVTVQVEIPRNSTFNSFYNRVFASLNPPSFFRSYLVHVKKADRQLKYGYYESNDEPLAVLLENVMTGKQAAARVTVPEGFNVFDIADTLAKKLIVEKQAFIDAAFDEAFVNEVTGIKDATSMEGFLYPDTYLLTRNSTPAEVIHMMYNNFLANMPDNFALNAKNAGMTVYEAVTLASIIQKETYINEEYRLVSSVFHNRLRRRMRLQADPTVIYGIYVDFDGNLRKKDLQDANNRYNTYRHNGLPPTPIANPGKQALSAAVDPAKTRYLYFVADNEGRHTFSVSYDEHRRKVYQFQK